jgi:hypothetical protein
MPLKISPENKEVFLAELARARPDLRIGPG